MAIQVMAFASRQGPDGGGVSITLDDDQIMIGQAADCDLRLPADTVSPYHAALVRHGGGYALVDDGTPAGTWMVAYGSEQPLRPVAPHVKHPLSGWTRVRFGALELVLNPHAEGPVDSLRDGVLFTLELVAQHRGWKGHNQLPFVSVRSGPDFGTRVDLHALSGVSRTFGRGLIADVPLRDLQASRRHFEVRCRASATVVRDLGSAGGTWLGKRRLEPGVFVPWEESEPLRAGKNEFVFRFPLSRVVGELGYQWDEGEEGSPYLWVRKRVDRGA